MNILVLNGPNLNMLGIREPDLYGRTGYDQLCGMILSHAEKASVHADVFQSNHEGELVDRIQQALGHYDGIIINAGAYTHTSIALLDALKAVDLPTVEVHITDVEKREDFRKVSYLRAACEKTISGHGLNGYLEAMDHLIRREKANQ